jgi:cell division inhibitor SulA
MEHDSARGKEQGGAAALGKEQGEALVAAAQEGTRAGAVMQGREGSAQGKRQHCAGGDARRLGLHEDL